MRTFILVLGWLALAAPLAAQEAAQPPAQDAADSTPEQPAAAPPEAVATPSPDRFTPSEEISLDLPVSFPVDI